MRVNSVVVIVSAALFLGSLLSYLFSILPYGNHIQGFVERHFVVFVYEYVGFYVGGLLTEIYNTQLRLEKGGFTRRRWLANHSELRKRYKNVKTRYRLVELMIILYGWCLD